MRQKYKVYGGEWNVKLDFEAKSLKLEGRSLKIEPKSSLICYKIEFNSQGIYLSV